jgi:hypothetical protein
VHYALQVVLLFVNRRFISGLPTTVRSDSFEAHRTNVGWFLNVVTVTSLLGVCFVILFAVCRLGDQRIRILLTDGCVHVYVAGSISPILMR